MLVCDWLLDTRWKLYEIAKNLLQHEQYISVPLGALSKFQNDLNSLRTIVQDMPVSILFIKINIPNPDYKISKKVQNSHAKNLIFNDFVV